MSQGRNNSVVLKKKVVKLSKIALLGTYLGKNRTSMGMSVYMVGYVGVIFKTEGSIWKMQKGHFFTKKKLKRAPIT